MWASGGIFSHGVRLWNQSVVKWISLYGQVGGEEEVHVDRILNIPSRCLHQAGQLSIDNLRKGGACVIEGHHPAVSLAA
jgi:hypothetical protein